MSRGHVYLTTFLIGGFSAGECISEADWSLQSAATDSKVLKSADSVISVKKLCRRRAVAGLGGLFFYFFDRNLITENKLIKGNVKWQNGQK